MLNANVDKHAPQVLQIEMDYRVKKLYASSKGEKKKIEGFSTKCLLVQKPAFATIAFDKEDLLLGETRHNRPLYFIGYIERPLLLNLSLSLSSCMSMKCNPKWKSEPPFSSHLSKLLKDIAFREIFVGQPSSPSFSS